MIVVSLLFFLLGVGLLAAGLVAESIKMELGAVLAALLSALALYAGVRQRRTSEDDEPAEPVQPWQAPLTRPSRAQKIEEPWSPPPPDDPWPTGPVAEVASAPVHDNDWSRAAEPDPADEPEQHTGEQTEDEFADDPGSTDITEYPSLDDEPAEEEVSPADVARVTSRSDDVLVVDGRPRYHRRACSSLIGRETVPLPVSEAREAGFSPCGRCRPDAHLLGSLDRPSRR
ncbi:MAG: hypothetical protein WCB04_14665 [Mycobacteriales bacterium]